MDRIPDHDEILLVASEWGANSDAPHLWRGLVGAWPLQEPGGMTAFDVSGWKQNGTLTGGPTRDVGSIGRYTSHNGSNQAIVVPDSPALTFPADFTVLAWAKPVSTDAAGVFLAKRHVSPTATGFLISQSAAADGRWAFGVHRDGTVVSNTSNVAPTGDWQHLVVRRAGEDLTYYVDGKVQTATGSIAGEIDSSESLYYGTDRNLTADCTGSLGPLAIYTRALAPAEIQQLYADPWAMYRLRTVVHPVAVAEPSGFKPYWARNVNTLIGGGVS